ncbi:MAG TPA: TIGR00730 family Rossman fold protein [Candidatus Babeliales bacterium]|nr:TIGR00730 family Rossman fold protein [Candidatus Babeliales bacterium]
MLKKLKEVFWVWWHLTRVYFQMLYGYWRVSHLPQPIVTIFGSARSPQTDLYAQQAHTLASMLINVDISVLTGGGPGIMEAANCGAVPRKGSYAKSVGISVTELGEKLNACVQESFALNYFFARKWLLTRLSAGFVVFPGGFGTIDEFSEIVTLIQTKKMKPLPVVLIGTEYWAPFMAWLNTEVLQHGFIAKEHLDLFRVTDDLDFAFCFVRDTCEIPGLMKR